MEVTKEEPGSAHSETKRSDGAPGAGDDCSLAFEPEPGHRTAEPVI